MDFKISIYFYMLLLLLLLLQISLVISQNNTTTSNTIPADRSQLTATNKNQSSPWLSPSEEFAFGFRQLDQSNDLFLLSIWFNKIPDKTIIWYANGDKPAPKGSKLLLNSKGLVLNDPKGTELWKSDPITGVVSHGLLNNTGNFVLEDSNSNNLWESFKDPKDTLLPTQIMERGGVVSSRFSETNFSKGRFQLRLLEDGNLVLNSINLPTNYTNEAYYRSDTCCNSNTGRQFVFDQSGHFYILRENGDRVELTKDVAMESSENSYFRATLNFDGVFILYKHPKNSTGNQNWTRAWSKPGNICLANTVDKSSGVCGYNSICSINEESSRPNCECPKGFSLISSSDQPFGNCKPDFEPNCEEDELNPNLYTFEVLINKNWPLSDYVALDGYTEDRCKASCLEDCMCSVAVFDLGNKCYKKKLPLSNGRVENAKTFVKVRKDNFTKKGLNNQTDQIIKKDQDHSLNRLVSALLGTSVFVNFILIGALCLGFFFIYQRKLKSTTTHDDGNSSVFETSLRCFTYKELVEATSEFNEELGRGAFGIVYKGKILLKASSSIMYVAVKKLNSVVQEMDGDKEFKTEVNVIGQTHHKNLVRLLGFCIEGTNRLLVYEFLSNGSLASFLFGDLKPSWNQRTQIAFGIARGLLYLHEECSSQIIHCDIKPQNILLDEYYNARISDFGLAKLLMMDQSYTHTNIRGTKGYVAPEWFRNIPITPKVDVYSFGVMLLEIICCRKSIINMEISLKENTILVDWAYDCYMEKKLDALVDYERDVLEDITMLERLVMVAIWCIQEDPSVRPTMKKVTQMLEGVVHVPIPLCPFTIRN